MSYLSITMSDYSKNYREIMKILYDRINERSSDIIKTYNETKDKIILETKFETKIEIEKNNYIHIDVALENTRSKINRQFSSYRRAVMQYLSDDDVDENLIRQEAVKLLQERQNLKSLTSMKKNGQLYVETDKGVLIDLLSTTSMDENNLKLEVREKKRIKKQNKNTIKEVSDEKFKEALLNTFKTLDECNAYPSKTNSALSKEDMVKIIEKYMKNGLYQNMPKGYKTKSKKEICRLLFEV